MYSITYECNNCGCQTTKEYKKKIKASETIDCKNCGCSAQKSVSKTPTFPFPIPYKPRDDKHEPWGQPWGQPWTNLHPWYQHIPNYNSNHINDGGITLC